MVVCVSLSVQDVRLEVIFTAAESERGLQRQPRNREQKAEPRAEGSELSAIGCRTRYSECVQGRAIDRPPFAKGLPL